MYEDQVDISYLSKFEFNSIYFEITSKCNAKCSYCYNNSLQNGTYVPYSKIKNIIEQAYQINQKTDFVFSGGEPLMHPNISDIVAFGCKNQSDITIITNGYLLKKTADVDNFYKCNFQVTIDTLDKRLHDSIRGTGSFSNIADLQRYMPNTNNKRRILRVNLSRDNLKYIKEFSEFALNNLYSILSFGFLVDQGRGKGNKNVLDYDNDDDWALCLQAIGEIKKYADKFKNQLIIERKNCYPKTGCELVNLKKPSMAIRIDPDGYVFPCLYFRDIHHSLGNINDNTITEILNGQIFLNLINSLLYRESHIDSCKDCIWDKQCFKGCPALAYSRFDSLDKEISCSFMKDTFEKALRSRSALIRAKND